MPQITIVILQYRPDAASLAMQDTRDFAVVLGDDGSAQDYFAESCAYLAAHGITDVQTTKLQPNGGTVKNARNAVRAAATRWVLMLSPGDFLYDSETLRWWLGRLQADEPRVAFGRQAYFTPDPPQPTAGETPFDRTPYDPAHYDAKAIRRNLLLYDDGISGAGLVYERTLFLSALDKMADHVRLAEDFSLRLFAVQGVRITRYDRLTVWYEYGGGVSTDAAARARMLGDWRAMLEVLRADWPMNITSTTAASPALCAGWWGGSSCRRTPPSKKPSAPGSRRPTATRQNCALCTNLRKRRMPPNDAAFTKIKDCRTRLAAGYRYRAAAHGSGGCSAVHAAGARVRLHESVPQP